VPRLRVVAVAARLPAWAEQACAEYARRMPRGYEVERTLVKKEPARLAGCIALDERGKDMTTRQFAALLGEGRTFLIGGADGRQGEARSGATGAHIVTDAAARPRPGGAARADLPGGDAADRPPLP